MFLLNKKRKLHIKEIDYNKHNKYIEDIEHIYKYKENISKYIYI